MKSEMRFEKDSSFIEIAEIHKEEGENQWIIESNIGFENLPVEFRDPVDISNKEGINRLKEVLSRWAERNEFKLVYNNFA